MKEGFGSPNSLMHAPNRSHINREVEHDVNADGKDNF